MTGFVAGSLLVIWPWKKDVETEFINRDGVAEMKTIGYEWLMPEMNSTTAFAIVWILVGCILVWLMEIFGSAEKKSVE